ncbi:MAG: ArsI/CadI family heavy metal resistance metalloenzyme [Bacteroidota bacterium]
MNMKSQFPRTHIGYGVKNIEATVEFYTKFFQAKPVKVKKDYAKFILEEPSLNISFSQSPNPIQPGHIHFGIELDEAEQLKQRLGSAMSYKLSIDEEKEVKCCYAKQDKFWVTDPDGYRWEVFIFKEDVEHNDKVNSELGECCAV